LGDDALYALAALIADRAGDRIAVDDFCGHGCPNAIVAFMAIIVISYSNAALPRNWHPLWIDRQF
jgi:hypothetical protein